MAKKQSSTKKKPAAAKKKAASVKKNASNAKKQTASASKRTASAKKLLPSGVVDEYRVSFLPIGDIDQIKEYIQDAADLFQEIADNNLTPIQRRRKIGAGIRNYGFIEKVADLAEENPQYAQFFDPNDLRNALMNFDLCRSIAVQLQSFLRDVTNTMLIYSNEGFIMSSMYYSTVKEMARRGDSKANTLFRTLQPFFKKPKRSSGALTEKQAEREMHSLLHGTKDGKLIVENVRPKLTGGVHKITEEKFTDTEQFKDSIEGNISE